MGVECSEGWWPLIADLDAELAAVVPEYRVLQVKEKFGALRFYYDLPSDAPREVWEKVQSIVQKYEILSTTVCEECGGDGRLRDDRAWIRTLCDVCDSVSRSTDGAH